MKQLLSLFLLCMCYSLAFAQTKQVKGKVTDDTGSPLSGVSVLLSGGKKGTQTDANGNFKQDVPATGKLTHVIS